jgi:hypothetical protein
MTVVVPFDDTDVSRVALRRATDVTDSADDIVAVTVIPKNNAKYARNKGWIGDDDAFDLATVESTLARTVSELVPEASFEAIVAGRYATAGEIANEVRRMPLRATQRWSSSGATTLGVSRRHSEASDAPSRLTFRTIR